MDISIIIVNYNTKELTSQCINSIYEKTAGLDFETILVDNASSDGSKEYFQNDNRITYIYSKENLGFGRANNLGLTIAKGKNILFLNPDTLLINNAIKILSNYIDQNPKVGACGGNLYNEEMKPTLSYRRIFPGIIEELNNLFFHIPEKLWYYKTWSHNNTDTPLAVAYICGADLMIRKEILDEVGAFSPDFFMYYEETDLCFRISKANYKIISIPSAKIQHLEGKSFKSSIDEKRIKVSENGRDIFYKRNYIPLYHKIADIIYIVSLSIHQIIFKVFGYNDAASVCKIKRNVFKRSNLF